MTDLEKQNRTQTSSPLSAGTYLCGDPCYCFDNNDPNGDLWSEWLAAAWDDVDNNRVTILDGEVRGMRIAASNTSCGDGVYEDQDGFEYGVDAGLLGAVDVRFLKTLYPSFAGLSDDDLEAKTGMRIEKFPAPFHISYEDGLVVIGRIRIET